MAEWVFSVDELAQAWQCRRSEVVRLCQTKELRSFRWRGCFYIRELAVVEYLMRRHKKNPGLR